MVIGQLRKRVLCFGIFATVVFAYLTGCGDSGIVDNKEETQASEGENAAGDNMREMMQAMQDEKTDMPEEEEEKAEANIEENTEEVSEEVVEEDAPVIVSETVLWEDEYCTVISAPYGYYDPDYSELFDGKNGWDIKVVTHKEGVSVAFADFAYIDDIYLPNYVGVEFKWYSTGKSTSINSWAYKESEEGLITQVGRLSINFTEEHRQYMEDLPFTKDAINKTSLDEICSIQLPVHIEWDNGGTGVYRENIIVADTLLDIYTNDTKESNLYISGQEEIFSAENEYYKIFLRNCEIAKSDSHSDSHSDRYVINFYIENLSDDVLNFMLAERKIYSDQQSKVFSFSVFGETGLLYTGFDNTGLTLYPGKGVYMPCELQIYEIDSFAKSVDENVMVSFFFKAFKSDKAEARYTLMYENTEEIGETEVPVSREQMNN